MKYKIISILLLTMVIFTFNFRFINAGGSFSEADHNSVATENAKSLNDIFEQGSGFLGGDDKLGASIRTSLQPITSALVIIGNLVFFSVGILLGLRYIWSSSEGKSQIKATLPTYLAGFAIFYFGKAIYELLSGELKDMFTSGSFDAAAGNIWQTLSAVVNILAIIGISTIGLRYMYSDSEQKAQIKKSAPVLILGIVMIYAISAVLGLLYDTGDELLNIIPLFTNII